jgi:DNA polymerase-3 subunit delta
MAVTLTGDNWFQLQSALRSITKEFIGEHGDLALERLDGDSADYGKIREAVTGLPFLASKKMVVLREPSKNKQFLENFEQVLNATEDTTELVIIEPKLDKRLSYYKHLQKKTDFREFKELDINGLASWLVQSAKQQNGELSLGDARYLAERVGISQQLLASELEKLLLYDPKITRQSIDLLTEAAPASTIFNLLEAAFAGHAKKTLSLYAEQRALKVEPPQIVAMLAWQLHVLAVIKTAGDRSAEQIAKEAGINPFVVRKSQSIANNLSAPELRQLISNLLEIDVRSKSSNIDADEALQKLLLEMTISS